MHDAWLVAEGVATAVVDRAEDRRRVVGVHERARSVVDRLAGDRRVVGVHHAVHEPDEHPAGDERRLRLDDGLEQRDVRLSRIGGRGVVAGDGVVGELLQQRHVATRGDVLERPDAQMAARHPGQHGARQQHLAGDRLAGRDDGERARRRDPERVHRLADEVLAQHRSERRPAVAAAGERCRSGALQVQVTAPALTVDELAEQQRAAVAEPWRVAAELMPGVGLGERRRSLGQSRTDERGDASGAAQLVDVEAQLHSQRLVEHDEARFGDRGGAPRLVQALQLGEGRALQWQRRPVGDDHHDDANGVDRRRPERPSPSAIDEVGETPKRSGGGELGRRGEQLACEPSPKFSRAGCG